MRAHSLPDSTIDHLIAWCRAHHEADAFLLFTAMLDGIRRDETVLDGDPDWTTVAHRIGIPNLQEA